MYKTDVIPKLNDLVGNVIELRNGNRYLVLKKEDGFIFGTRQEGKIYITGDYDSNLKDIKVSSSWDIMKVYAPSYDTIPRLLNASSTVIWERKEIKEMTVADVEKLVGCSVKIVK